MRLLAVLAISQAVVAKKTFQNSGNLKVWDMQVLKKSATIEELKATDAPGGQTGLKFTQHDDQLFDPKYGPDYAAELQVTDGYSPGTKRYYAMTWQIPVGFKLNSNTKYEIMRFITDYNGQDCLGIYEVLTVWFKSEFLGYTIRTQDPCPESSEYEFTSTDVKTNLKVTSGKDMKLVLGASWQHAVQTSTKNNQVPQGFLEFRLDDKTFRNDKIVTTPNNEAHVNFRVGFTPVQYSYISGEHGAGTPKFESNMKNRYILIKKVVVADTPEEVGILTPKAKRDWQA